jgi:hypothetical protein
MAIWLHIVACLVAEIPAAGSVLIESNKQSVASYGPNQVTDRFVTSQAPLVAEMPWTAPIDHSRAVHPPFLLLDPMPHIAVSSYCEWSRELWTR